MFKKLTKDEVLIAQIQKELMKLGYQWEERIYNDGNPYNCYVIFTKNNKPHYFTDNILGDFGWGRFTRITAWKKAYEFLAEL